MRFLRHATLPIALLLVPLALSSSAPAATFSDVGKSFWARSQISWAVQHGFIARPRGAFRPRDSANRASVARVLAYGYSQRTHAPVPRHFFRFAVSRGLIDAGQGPRSAISQGAFDRALVRLLNLRRASGLYNRLRTRNGLQPNLPLYFGAEQVVRHLGLRVNTADDSYESSPTDPLLRAGLAAEAFQLGHLESWRRAWAMQNAAVGGALPRWTPLRRAVLGFALRSAGKPYVWGGASPKVQTLFSHRVAGGFDCSGYLWWVFKRNFAAEGRRWNGTSALPYRTTFAMAAHVKRRNRIPYAKLRAGDILFWTSGRSHGISTTASVIDHSGIYLGHGWAISSASGTDGVTIDTIAPGAGWLRDHFAFGWRILPPNR